MLLSAALIVAAPSLVRAQTPPNDPPPVTLNGYVQAQYEEIDRPGEANDRAYVRRLVLTVEAAPAASWVGRIQADLAPTTVGDAVVIRDAYLRYTGWAAHGLTLTVGNQKLPFSRSFIVSSARRGLVERTVIGERSFGTPGRSIAMKLDGHTRSDLWQWSGAVASALHSPDAATLRIDGIADAASDWNEGVVALGRIELHPLGNTPRDQGDFGSGMRVVIGGAGYIWRNDGDTNAYTDEGRALSRTLADVQQAQALELSGGLRGHRLSLDAEYHRVAARTVDTSFSGGLYMSGKTSLNQFGVEAGWMLVRRRLEALAAFDTMTVAGRDAIASRPAVGANWYFSGHNVKLEMMHRETYNDRGVRGARLHATYLQAQIAF
jgi:hypothetical protein